MAKTADIFQKMQISAFRAGVNPRTEESREWFRLQARKLRAGRMKREYMLESEEVKLVKSPQIGRMYMYFYDPKTKDKLPFYDAFPLVIPIGPAEGGFYGLNMHYLPPILRARMFDSLLKVVNNDLYDESTEFNIDYRLLKRMSGAPYYKGALKHYLYDHISSRVAEIQPTEWEIAMFLPTASWQKGTAAQVYSWSQKQIYKR